MKKYLFVLSIFALNTVGLFAQSSPVSITVTSSSWKSMYAWIWNTAKKIDNRFIPMKQVNDSTWTLTIDADLEKHKDAGILFVDTDSWNSDLQKTNDLRLCNACYVIPQNQKQGQIVKRPNGLVCRELIFECKKVDCK